MSIKKVLLLILYVVLSSYLIAISNGWMLVLMVWFLGGPYIVCAAIAGRLISKDNFLKNSPWIFIVATLVEVPLAALIYWNGGQPMCAADVCTKEFVPLFGEQMTQAFIVYAIIAAVYNLITWIFVKGFVRKDNKKLALSQQPSTPEQPMATTQQPFVPKADEELRAEIEERVHREMMEQNNIKGEDQNNVEQN